MALADLSWLLAIVQQQAAQIARLEKDIAGLRAALLHEQKRVGKIAFAETHAFERAKALESALREVVSAYGPSTDYSHEYKVIWERAEAALSSPPTAD